jgi:hypothetical protein
MIGFHALTMARARLAGRNARAAASNDHGGSVTVLLRPANTGTGWFEPMGAA